MTTTDPTTSSEAPGGAGRGAFDPHQGDPSFHATLDAIADVAAHAAGPGDDPTGIGRVRFDAAREELGLALPTAQALVKRYRRPLAILIEMALEPVARRARAAGIDSANAVDHDFPNDLMILAIQAAAMRCGRSPGTLDYDQMVEAEKIARAKRGIPAHALPHSATITSRFGSWDAALAAAGYAPAVQVNSRRAEPAHVILDRFITQHGFIASSGYLEEYCRLTATPLGRDLKPYARVIEACRALRAERGDSMPTGMPGPASRPTPADLAAGATARAARPTTREWAIESIRAYRREGMRPGTTPTYRGYKAFSRGRDDLMSATTIVRHWGFAAIVEAAGI